LVTVKGASLAFKLSDMTGLLQGCDLELYAAAHRPGYPGTATARRAFQSATRRDFSSVTP
jgi:hypothetical protein